MHPAMWVLLGVCAVDIPVLIYMWWFADNWHW